MTFVDIAISEGNLNPTNNEQTTENSNTEVLVNINQVDENSNAEVLVNNDQNAGNSNTVVLVNNDQNAGNSNSVVFVNMETQTEENTNPSIIRSLLRPQNFFI